MGNVSRARPQSSKDAATQASDHMIIDFSTGKENVLRAREANRTAETITDDPTLRSTTRLLVNSVSVTDKRSAELELSKVSKEWGLGEPFEDGVENEVSRGVQQLIASYGLAATDAILQACVAGELTPTALAEALLWLGLMDHDLTREARFSILVFCLRDRDKRIKSSAAVGLASLEDQRAALLIRHEADYEGNRLLQSRLLQIAEELGGA